MIESYNYTEADLSLFEKKGISALQVTEQLNSMQQGFPYLSIHDYATIGHGVHALDKESCTRYTQYWRDFLNGDNRICKFVPASGAASRMFKELFEYLEAPLDTPPNSYIEKFFSGIDRFAFRETLNKYCLQQLGESLAACVALGKEREVLKLLLRSGMNYGNFPKGVLEFHRYEGGITRTPIEEHLVEGALYAKDKSGVVQIHFTVSQEHLNTFRSLIEQKISDYEAKFGVRYEVSFSFQKPSTDTVAADSDNRPFREFSGEIVFRPGGHGALIENLNDLSADIIFIKNIDNVVPDHFKGDTIIYKEVIAGLLVDIRRRVFDYLSRLDSSESIGSTLIAEIACFTEQDLSIKLPDQFQSMAPTEQANYFKTKLNRPIRVCGVVKNSGEPGGGPYWINNNDGSISLQILESSQIDLHDKRSSDLLKESTHFNPVDLVCSITDYTHKKFDLKQYVDSQTGFISSKSKGGKVLKALELPGLWNGAMADWITLLVEVPLSTFNPVKSVSDLLRKEHQ